MKSAQGVEKVGKDQYRVDFATFWRGQQPILKRLLAKPRAVEVDPYLIARAVRTAMRLCEIRHVDGQPLVWNEYEIFLSSRDHQGLLPLVSGLKAGLDTVIRQTLQELGAKTVGDPIVRLKIDEESEIQPGTADLLVYFKENRDIAAPRDGEMTVRVTGTAAHAAASPDETDRVEEPPGTGALRLIWLDGEATIPLGAKYLVGKPHAQPPENFITLVGAGKKINRHQMAIENTSGAAVISRPARANPVEVQGRLIQAGGQGYFDQLPVEISLSAGDLVLRLERIA